MIQMHNEKLAYQQGYEDGYRDGQDKGYADGEFIGRAKARKDFDDIEMGLSQEDARRVRIDTIDECIAKIKEEWSYYDETCFRICNELEQLKSRKQ